jgi:hypothetical protein
LLVSFVLVGTATWLAADRRMIAADFAVQQKPDGVIITDDGRSVATCVFRDDKILRPYFANVHAPGGPWITPQHRSKHLAWQARELTGPAVFEAKSFGPGSMILAWRIDTAGDEKAEIEEEVCLPEAVWVAHTLGKPIVSAEAFTFLRTCFEIR